MSDYTRAAESLRNLAVLFQGVLDTAAILEKIGSLQKAEDEIKASMDNLRAQRAQLMDDTEAARRNLISAQNERNMLIAQRDTDIAASKEAAKAEAKGLVDAAKDKAAKLVNDATKKAKDIEQESQRRIDALNAEQGKLNARIEAMTSEIEAKSAQASGIEARIASAKNHIESLLRG